jgi:hypothetical protein
VEAIKLDLPAPHTYKRIIQELTVEHVGTQKNASEPRVHRFEEILNGKKTPKVRNSKHTSHLAASNIKIWLLFTSYNPLNLMISTNPSTTRTSRTLM